MKHLIRYAWRVIAKQSFKSIPKSGVVRKQRKEHKQKVIGDYAKSFKKKKKDANSKKARKLDCQKKEKNALTYALNCRPKKGSIRPIRKVAYVSYYVAGANVLPNLGELLSLFGLWLFYEHAKRLQKVTCFFILFFIFCVSFLLYLLFSFLFV